MQYKLNEERQIRARFLKAVKTKIRNLNLSFCFVLCFEIGSH
jgi:hypothetical protein